MRSLVLFTFLVLASPALAGDGIVEINAACAAVGCFGGDAAGYPATDHDVRQLSAHV